MNFLESLMNVLTNKTTPQRTLTGMYTQQPDIGGLSVPMTEPLREDKQIIDFIRQRNPYVYRAAYEKSAGDPGYVTPEEAWQIITQGNIPGYKPPNPNFNKPPGGWTPKPSGTGIQPRNFGTGVR